jgi:hypothetical protein
MRAEKQFIHLVNETIEVTLDKLSGNKNSAVIPLAWPELTARGPEKIWGILRKARIVKNVNFKVGHAAMVVALDDEFHYFDFGRYITPIGFGRARSAETDPKLVLNLIPEWSNDRKLLNFEALCQELENIKIATHGDGPMFASIHYHADIIKVLTYAKSVIDLGYTRYNAFKTKDSNCARFVSKSLMAGWNANSQYRSRFKTPITIAPTPYFNVVAAASDGRFLIWENGKGEYHKRPRHHALKDLFIKLLESFLSSKAQNLPTDSKIGLIDIPTEKPIDLPDESVYLGGVGEAAWHNLEITTELKLFLTRYDYAGEMEFSAEYLVSTDWISKLQRLECKLVHDTHYCWLTLCCLKTNEKKRFYRKL